ncbi:rhodanese-like domain-containing protein [Croceibacter atlanticus]|uniref:rhodanese-like domain-containing protein n=1 Tax=Croceibacter atlanticus TaxID=313588 RepID=UPI003CD0D0FA
MGSVTNLSPESFLYNAKLHNIIIDIRQDKTERFLNGVFRFRCDKVFHNCIDLDTTLPLYIFCENGRKSGQIARKLATKGHNVYKLRGGYQAWKRYLKID